MNIIALLYGAVTLTVASPMPPVQYGDSVRVPPPPVLTDSLLMQWHSALLHVYDTLSVHPELQQVAGLAPLVLTGRMTSEKEDCQSWVGQSWSDTASFARQAVRQASMPNYPVDKLAQALSEAPALAAAVHTTVLTPGEFAATTSAIQQTLCYEFFLRDKPKPTSADGPNYFIPGDWKVDPQTTLGKNIAYFFPFEVEGKNSREGKVLASVVNGTDKEYDVLRKQTLRVNRARHLGPDPFNQIATSGNSKKPKKKMEDMLLEMLESQKKGGVNKLYWLEVIDSSGRELPIK